MIAKWFFNERKTVVINVPFPNKNERFSKRYYANGKIKFNIIWTTFGQN